MKPPFPYFGGKGVHGPRIAAMLPSHGHYVEPYCGSLAVLLAKSPAPHETVNDLDRSLMTFWRVLRERPADLERVCALTPHSLAEFTDAEIPDERATPVWEPGGPRMVEPEPVDELEVARRVWVRLTQGRAGAFRATGWRHYVAPAGSTSMPDYLDGYTGRMAAAAKRLHRVSLECRPALEVVGWYGRDPGVLLYVDPPYLRSTRNSGGYRHEMTEADHVELAAALRQAKASAVLSGYPSPLYDDLYDGWHRTEFTSGTGQNAETWGNRIEVLWSNRPFPQGSLFDMDQESA